MTRIFIRFWYFRSTFNPFLVFQKHITHIQDHSRPHSFKIIKDETGKAVIWWKDLSTDKVGEIIRNITTGQNQNQFTTFTFKWEMMSEYKGRKNMQKAGFLMNQLI